MYNLIEQALNRNRGAIAFRMIVVKAMGRLFARQPKAQLVNPNCELIIIGALLERLASVLLL